MNIIDLIYKGLYDFVPVKKGNIQVDDYVVSYFSPELILQVYKIDESRISIASYRK